MVTIISISDYNVQLVGSLLRLLVVTKFIRIGIADKNDTPPYFEKALYEVEVQENEDIGHNILTITTKNHQQFAHVQYEITSGNINGIFVVNNTTGAIYIAKALDYETRNRYELKLSASSNSQHNYTTVLIHVKDVNDNPPIFEKTTYRTQITEEEDRNLPKSILKVKATDGDKDRPQDIIYFLTGQGIDPDDSANSKFSINRSIGEIFVLKPLDRDQPNGRPQWRFTVFAQDEGGEGLVGYADVQVNLKDINDNAPIFPQGVYFGSVTENGTDDIMIMTMAAVDYDDPLDGVNAKLIYSIEKNVIEEDSGTPIFKIGSETGVLRTAVCCLDRERTPDYSIQVVAIDGGGLKGTGTASIIVQDINDMPPFFTKDEWFTEVEETDAKTLPEMPILTVTVHDEDEVNDFQYKVLQNSGYGADKFIMIRNNDGTGSLKIIQHLDFEDPLQSNGFRFRIQVNDMGESNETDKYHVAYSWIVVKLRDINDNEPVFDKSNIEIEVLENAEVGKSLVAFNAKDPDQGGNSKISYVIDKSSDRRRQFSINQEGVVTIQRPLDREKMPRYEVTILAIDDGIPSKTASATLTIIVQDINDNAPKFLTEYRPVITEHDAPKKVVELFAVDEDDKYKGNGPPFLFELDPSVSDLIRSNFKVEQDKKGANGEGTAIVTSLRSFDREQQKEFHIPILIRDNGTPSMIGTSTLTVVVGDINDNKMQSASKDILVYNYYQVQAAKTEIGQVYVDDLDDWDFYDKNFYWAKDSEHTRFTVNEDTGMIYIKHGTRDGLYHLRFNVFDKIHIQTVIAVVTVTVKTLPQEAVRNSGSMRIAGTTDEQFISVWDHKLQAKHKSKAQKFREKLAELLNVNTKNIEVFSVQLRQKQPPVTDIRFSVQENFDYYKAVRLNGLVLMFQREIERVVGINITMLGIDECLYENNICEGSCTNRLNITGAPYLVNANKTALVSIKLNPVAECICAARHSFRERICKNSFCSDKGTCTGNSGMCSCPDGSTVPRCQQTSRSFRGNGWAWFPSLEMCNKSHLHFEFVTKIADGLLLYNGPIGPPKKDSIILSDYIAVELDCGYPRFLVNFGSGTLELKVKTRKTLDDGEWHRLDLYWDRENVRIVVDHCKSAYIVELEDGNDPEFDDSSCQAQGTMPPFDEYLNLNTPLQMGGIYAQEFDPNTYNWQYVPVGKNFDGCIRNLFLNSKLYDLAHPGFFRHSMSECPQTDAVCHGSDTTRCWQHGSCIGNMNEHECLCLPGWTGSSCSIPTVPTTFGSQSYIKYALSFELDKFSTQIQLRFRTREGDGELFRVSDQHSREYAILEIKNSRLRFRYNLNSLKKDEKDIWINTVTVNDGQWHFAKVSRYGSEASLELDSGEGQRYNETLNNFSGHQWLLIDKQEGVYGGGKAEYTGVKTFEVSGGFQKGCLDDIRLNGKYLPLPPAMNGTQWGQATMARNLVRGCESNTSCKHIFCPEPFECVDLWNDFECTCGKGRIISDDSKHCTDIDECLDLPCLNGGTCANLESDLRYRCSCPDGFLGENCQLIQEGQILKLSFSAMTIILACLITVLILVLVCVIYTHHRKSRNKYPNPNDDVRENIINYDDEGGGEDDMTAFDITPLQIPINTEQKFLEPEPHLNSLIQEYKDFADKNISTPPFDDLRNYAFEGGESTTRSLSSLASSTDEEQQDYGYLDAWGPRFDKLANLFNSLEEDHIAA
ncbi:unnamed protein product [Ceutorhynchus assimilis]|uniref:Neural-cadherin n=1 Tax=Ceutorhynchus assimilis TaxID=467358 RepID=A0A9P0GN46_9CUCU|nr:unnamed protein product [Ceutorhynchus assimilis]